MTEGKRYSFTSTTITGPGVPSGPVVTPRQKHPQDLAFSLVMRELPAPSVLPVTQLFDGPGAVGFCEMGGMLVTFVVDPIMPPRGWRVEQAATGEVMRGGDDYRRAFR